jgi:hypothetical protein
MEFYPLTGKEREDRIIWASVRAVIESFQVKYKRNGKKSKSHWTLFERLLRVFEILLKVTGLYQKGLSNATAIELNKELLEFHDLPQAFYGFKILHISDLHIDTIKGFEELIIKKINNTKFDLCVMTGDFRRDVSGSIKQVVPAIEKLMAHINATHGTLAVLGNHDTFKMVESLEPFNIRFLVNETVFIEKNGEKLYISGTDDPYHYYTDMALLSLEKDFPGFKICLSHTSELVDIAAKNYYKLYLCGHTHGGQICLPGGISIIHHQKGNRDRVRGLWTLNGMTGYTSRGVGVSGTPLRFNCPPEITLFELQREALSGKNH